jgi:hypothetical protein
LTKVQRASRCAVQKTVHCEERRSGRD